MTTFLLIRHGETDALGRFLAGRMAGCHLNNSGKRQVCRLAEFLSRLTMHAIYTSPLERAVETAEAVGKPHGLAPVVRDGLNEMRFGVWEGQTFEELDRDPNWVRFNQMRSLACPPCGELMIEAQNRIVSEIEDLTSLHKNETVAVVSHLDPLRAVIAHCLRIPLDLLLSFEINPGSLSVLRYVNGTPHVLCMNRTGELIV